MRLSGIHIGKEYRVFVVSKIIKYFKTEINRKDVIYFPSRKYLKDFIQKIVKFRKLIDVGNRTTSYRFLLYNFIVLLNIII